MTEKMKTTAPVSSVGADGAQPQLKNYNEIIANEQHKSICKPHKTRRNPGAAGFKPFP